MSEINNDDDIIVTSGDPIQEKKTSPHDEPRRMHQFDKTNSPLSADELRRQREYLQSENKQAGEWSHRTGSAVEETTPQNADARITTGLTSGEKPLTDFNAAHEEHPEWKDLDEEKGKPEI